MSSERDDGGPAFPVPHGASQILDTGGMSLRDWFAGRALAGLIEKMSGEDASTEAYKAADAMLAARGEPGQ